MYKKTCPSRKDRSEYNTCGTTLSAYLFYKYAGTALRKFHHPEPAIRAWTSQHKPAHILPLTQACGPDTGAMDAGQSSQPAAADSGFPAARFLIPAASGLPVHLSLSGPFAVRLITGIPPSPALCECPLRFDLRFIGLILYFISHYYRFHCKCQ